MKVLLLALTVVSFNSIAGDCFLNNGDHKDSTAEYVDSQGHECNPSSAVAPATEESQKGQGAYGMAQQIPMLFGPTGNVQFDSSIGYMNGVPSYMYGAIIGCQPTSESDKIQCPDGIYKKDTSSDNSERALGDKSNTPASSRSRPSGNNSGPAHHQ